MTEDICKMICKDDDDAVMMYDDETKHRERTRFKKERKKNSFFEVKKERMDEPFTFSVTAVMMKTGLLLKTMAGTSKPFVKKMMMKW